MSFPHLKRRRVCVNIIRSTWEHPSIQQSPAFRPGIEDRHDYYDDEFRVADSFLMVTRALAAFMTRKPPLQAVLVIFDLANVIATELPERSLKSEDIETMLDIAHQAVEADCMCETIEPQSWTEATDRLSQAMSGSIGVPVSIRSERIEDLHGHKRMSHM